ncbi:MAG: autotransporter domain-containing protein, partial [Stenotrophomonas sp.]
STLQIGNGGATGAIVGDVSNNGALVVNLAGNTALAGIVSGSGGLTQAGAGTLTLTGNNTYTGGTTINTGSTLQVGNGGATGAITGNVSNNGSLVYNVGGNTTVAGTISGSGGLTQAGSGTLTLTGNNSYAGGTTINTGGTLQVGNGGSTGAITGNVNNNGSLLFNVGGSTTVDGVVSGTGGLTQAGSGTLVLTGNNTYTGGTTINAGGTMQVGTGGASGAISGDITNNGGLVLNVGGNTTLGGAINGGGSIVQNGPGAVTIGGNSGGFTGTGQVNAGGLNVTGNIGGQWTIGTGTTLSGTGTIGGSTGTTTVSAGGVLSPGNGAGNGSSGGNGIGTITVGGNLTLAPGSTLAVDLGSTSSDVVQVGGSANVGGAALVVNAINPNTSYQQGQQYTVVNAAGGVNGQFVPPKTTSAFLSLTPVYTPNAAQLKIDVAQTAAFVTAAQTRNQRGVAGALDSLPQTGAALGLYNTVLMYDAATARSAFNQLSGESHAATRSVLLRDNYLEEGIRQRLGSELPSVRGERASAWLAGSGKVSRQDGDGNGDEIRNNRNAAMAGVDWNLGEHAVLGVAAGSERLDTRLYDRDSRAKTRGNTYGLYAQGQWNDFSVGGSVSRGDYRTRTTREVPLLQQTLYSRQDADVTIAQVEAAWTWTAGRTQLQPYVNFSRHWLDSDSAVEQGGSAALVLEGGKHTLNVSTAGVRGRWDVGSGERFPAQLTVGVGWQHTSGDTDVASRQRFAVGGDAFDVYGARFARNAVVSQLGVAVGLGRSSQLSLFVQGEHGDGRSDVGGQLNLRVGF